MFKMEFSLEIKIFYNIGLTGKDNKMSTWEFSEIEGWEEYYEQVKRKTGYVHANDDHFYSM